MISALYPVFKSACKFKTRTSGTEAGLQLVVELARILPVNRRGGLGLGKTEEKEQMAGEVLTEQGNREQLPARRDGWRWRWRWPLWERHALNSSQPRVGKNKRLYIWVASFL